MYHMDGWRNKEKLMLRDGSEPPLWYFTPIQPDREHRRHVVNAFVIVVLCALTLALLLVAIVPQLSPFPSTTQHPQKIDKGHTVGLQRPARTSST